MRSMLGIEKCLPIQEFRASWLNVITLAGIKEITTRVLYAACGTEVELARGASSMPKAFPRGEHFAFLCHQPPHAARYARSAARLLRIVSINSWATSEHEQCIQ